MARIREVDHDGTVVIVRFEDSTHRFHALWLRDNSLDPTTRSSVNGQRLVTINDIAADTRVTSCTTLDDGNALNVTFSPCGTTSVFSASWLATHAYDRTHATEPGWISADIQTWDRTTRADQLPRVSWKEMCDDDSHLLPWLSGVHALGVGIVTDMPRTPGFLCEMARRFSFVRETNYGMYFEVRAEVTPTNLAYTNLGLQAHTDNPYRDPVPTMQILACLENSVVGGESSVVDGFAIASRLRAEDPRAFALLASSPVRFAYDGTADVSLRAKRPIIECGPDGQLLAIRFNNRSTAPVVDVPFDTMPAFYDAYRKFASLVDNPDFAITFSLRPGDAFIVDNTRVLHARRAFSGSGHRWLQGCYVDKDGLESTLRVLEASA